MAAILVFGLPSVAGAQADQKDHGNGSAKQADKADQAQKPRSKGQARPARQQPSAAQGHQQQAPAQHQPAPPAAQNRVQRPAAQGRSPQAGSPAYLRPGAMQGHPQQPTARRPQVQPPVRSAQPQQRSYAQGRNRLTPPSRHVVQPAVAPRYSGPRVEQRAVWPRYRAQSWNTQHRTWGQRGGYNGYRIPSASFSLYFGRPHRYHLSNFNVRIVGNYPQFYADGFWFSILDPVPEYWGGDWYDTDYVTVVQNEDGYYLLNEAYPDAALAISVQL
jgi:hypothetical protein